MRDWRAGFLFCLAAAAGFSTVPILGKIAYAIHVNLITLLAGRFLLTSSILWLIVAATRQSLPAGRSLAAGLILGIVGFGVQVTLLFVALQRIDAALTSLLFYSYPAMVTAAVLLTGREGATLRRLSALAIALAGVVLVFSSASGARRDATGVLLTLVSAFLYSLIVLAVDRLALRSSPLTLSAVASTGAAGTFLLSGAALSSLQSDLTLQGWGVIVGLAIATSLALASFYRGIATVGPSTASIVLTVEPVLTVVLAALLLGDRLDLWQIVGGSMVLSAVLLLQWPQRENASQETGR